MVVAGEIAAAPAFTVSLHDSVVDAAKVMRDKGIGDVIVVDDHSLVVGMLTDRDVTVRVVADHRDPEQTEVAAVCTRNPVTVEVTAGVEKPEQLMRAHLIHRLPVVDRAGHPLGMLSLEDLAASGYIDDHELREVLKTIARAYWRRSAAIA